MHVAMVAPHFHPEVGGVETSVKLFATWLARRGHDVTVHTAARALDGRELPPIDQIDGVEVRRYPVRFNLGYFRSAFRPEATDADVVHLHGYAVLTNDLVARRTLLPIVYSLHHGVSMPHPTRWVRLERSLYDRIIGFRTLGRAAAVLAQNRHDLEWLSSRRVRVQKALVLPTPLPDSAFLKGEPARVRDRFDGGRFVLCLGRLHREKGVLALVETLSSIEEVEVWFAGPDAGAGSELRRRAQALGVTGRVRILGLVSDDEKRDLLAASEFLVVPSRYEAQGLVIAEAWAQGKAVVASRVGALADWIESDRTGVLVSPEDVPSLRDAIASLLAAPARAESMGRLGAAQAEALRLDRLGSQLEAVYESVLDRGRG